MRDRLRFSLSERDKGTYVRDSLVALPEPSMRPSDSSTFILFVYMYFLASCMGARASPGVASYFSIALFLRSKVFVKLGKFV